MTGATSGIGLHAARRLTPMAALTVGARQPKAVQKLLGSSVRALPLDLADLRSAAAFADAAADGPLIDRLILNAGLQTISGDRSVQGMELTFAANHLAHFLILKALTPRLAPNARVILTSSGTHDPALNTSIPPPVTADARRLAHPDRAPDFDGDPTIAGRRAYSSSKLCNVMTAREAAARLASSRPDVAFIAFDPGLTPGTGLARGYAPWQNFVFRHVMGRFVKGEKVSTPQGAGAGLAALALDPAYAGARGDYWALRNLRLTATQPSVLARDAAAGAKLWDDSEALIAEATV
ncbi:protochlorophyllide reductase [soil metagenome]